MTVDQIIQKLSGIRRHNFSKEELTEWIQELEERLENEVWTRYFECNPRYLHYPTDKDAHIFIESPYHKLYLLYLLAQMDFYNGNLVGYNAYVRAYNMELQSYMSYLARHYKAIA